MNHPVDEHAAGACVGGLPVKRYNNVDGVRRTRLRWQRNNVIDVTPENKTKNRKQQHKIKKKTKKTPRSTRYTILFCYYSVMLLQ